jgi:Restriction endonuclease AspBHI N-terminal/Restriction endonuclease
MDKVVQFDQLATSDLVVDAVYKAGTAKHVGDDPINQLLPVGNTGGIRFGGSIAHPRSVALVTSNENLDWPDSLDRETGMLTYFGDNRTPGKELHDTPKHGNEILRNAFDAAHGGPGLRATVPPFFVFEKVNGRDYRFLGLAVPGSEGTDYADDLIGIWRSRNGVRYQIYRATLTILNVPVITRVWLDDLVLGHAATTHTPSAWKSWRNTGIVKPLRAPRIIQHRTKAEQEPATSADLAIVKAVYEHFTDRPHDFEAFAANIVQRYLPDVTKLDVTRPSRDGGRDAIGQYRIGSGGGEILLDFSMEAKCYQAGSPVGVRELSRLISRLRHRQFGVLVTTSHLHSQAYKELKEDAHPIIVIAGRDIASILRTSGAPVGAGFGAWLTDTFPPPE